MKQDLGLFIFVLTLSTAAYSASSTLFFRATKAETFSVQMVGGVPTMITNIDNGHKPLLKIAKQGNTISVTVIQP